MTLPELAPQPSSDQFARLASAIDPDAKVVATRQLTGGISCRMDVMTLEIPRGVREVVVRQYGPWHEKDNLHPATTEASVLTLLEQHDIPVPSIVLDHEATENMGRRTVVTSFIDGQAVVQPVDQQRWAEQLVEAIARVHTLNVPPSVRRHLPSLYPHLDRTLSKSEPSENIARHPLGEKLWQATKELWRTVDKSADSLIHADYWPGNTLWKNEQLVAIVDWEEPRLGEPTWDIATIIQDSAIFGMDVEKFVLDHHKRVSDRPLRDYRFWRMYIAMCEMPDPGLWVDGYRAMGGGNITADKVRANHTASIERLLEG